jgi:L-aminopeptidase/D-esterase-like protein
LGYEAAAAAAARPEGHEVERGNIGAGTGALIGRGAFKGGVGTASVTLEDISPDGPVVIGALAVVNAVGFPLISTPDGAAVSRDAAPEAPVEAPPLNTTLVVVATNAVLDAAECKRTASAAHAGIARALNPSHTLADGDTVFALATGAVGLDRSNGQAQLLGLLALQSAAAGAVQAAILDGVDAAVSVSTPAGEFPAYDTTGVTSPGRVR